MAWEMGSIIVEENEEPSAEDLLNDLDYEMANCALVHVHGTTVPNRIRQLLAKIAFKVHKEKEPLDRSSLLEAISENTDLLKRILKLIEECTDSNVLGNLLAISRELLAARSLWRPSALGTFLAFEATEIIGRLLVRVCKPVTNSTLHQPSLSDHSFVCCFWILSALATKDTKFSTKICQSGAIKAIYPILKHLSGKVGNLYPVLQVVKALSRNNLASTTLGKEGLVPMVTNIVTKLAKNPYSPRLKVAAEALSVLTKTRPNQLLLTKGSYVQDLVDVFVNYEREVNRGKITIKITGALLYIFQHLVGSKIGKQHFLEAGGLESLREFSYKPYFDGKGWDRLLYRACTVLCKVCEAKSLPVGTEICPAKYTIPDGHLIQPEVESSSESTSRETTPESEGSDEEDENEDDLDEETLAQQEDESNLLDMDIVPAKPIIHRKTSDLAEEYSKFFIEYSNPEVLESHSNTKWSFSPSDSRASREHYLAFAQQTYGLIKFAKVAYPDLVSGHSPPDLEEPLLEKNKQACRGKVINNIRRILNEVGSDEKEQKVVYDLDELIVSDKMLGRLATDNSAVSNNDEEFVNDFNEANQNTSQLEFESRFECGNLRKAIHTGGRQYNLILNPDVNSDKHHQWFYFQVSHMKGGEHYPYIFNIINYEKTNSQFIFGMQPVMFSVKEAMEGRPHWRRVGADICYFRNNFSKSSQINGDNYMTASFTITFPHDGDVCYLAYHYPYTYSRLRAKLDILSSERRGFYFKIDTLTNSLNDQEVPVLTITSKPIQSNPLNLARPLSNPNIPLSDKPIIVLTGRVHPGETNASWVMEGILDFLTGDTPEAEDLRSHFTFKIVPMLNVDGVINGCHRCGLTGEDLNRRWQDPHAKLHPVIYHSKGLISYIKQVLAKDIFLFCDFHGHSRKKNVFVYGCSLDQSWWPQDHEFYDDPSVYKQLGEIMHNIEPTFDKRSCRYTIERGRESTARVVVWREFDVPRSYTLEASFSGCSLGQLQGLHLKTQHLQNTGMTFLQALMNLETGNENVSENHSECKASIEKDQALKITRLHRVLGLCELHFCELQYCFLCRL